MHHPPPLTSPNRETRRRLACSCLFLPSRAEASRLPSGGPAPDHTAHLFLAAGLEWLETGSSPPRHHDIHVMTILFVLTPGGRRVQTRRTAFTTRDRRRSSVRGEGGDTAHASCLPACQRMRVCPTFRSAAVGITAHSSVHDIPRCVRLRSRDTVILGHGRSTWNYILGTLRSWYIDSENAIFGLYREAMAIACE